MTNDVHLEIETGECLQHKIFLIQRFAIKELVEVHHRLVRIPPIVGIRTARLTVLSLDSVEMVRCPIDGFTKQGGILDDKVVLVARSY